MNEEITFTVEPCLESGGYVARWDDPMGRGGITTQGDSLTDAVQGFLKPRSGRVRCVCTS